MTITVNNYISDYWLTDNIIDCGNIIIDEDQDNLNNCYNINDINDMNINEEKLNNNHKYEDDYNNKIENEFIPRITKFNRKCKNGCITKYYNRRYNDRNKHSNDRMYNKKESYQYNEIHKHTISNSSYDQMHALPQNSRIYEYEKRKNMLDTFNIIKNNYL
jgi:hypothetical protein